MEARSTSSENSSKRERDELHETIYERIHHADEMMYNVTTDRGVSMRKCDNNWKKRVNHKM